MIDLRCTSVTSPLRLQATTW